MEYKRLFIIRKDLEMSAGKLAAQVAHCAEGYWLNIIREAAEKREQYYEAKLFLDTDMYERYCQGSYVKTICAARNKQHLLKAVEQAVVLGLKEGESFGLIYDECRTELQPEEPDGTTITGIWFAPLEDELARQISRKYQLYK